MLCETISDSMHLMLIHDVSDLIHSLSILPVVTSALLEVQDAKFYEGLQPLQFADTPSLQSTVTAIVTISV